MSCFSPKNERSFLLEKMIRYVKNILVQITSIISSLNSREVLFSDKGVPMADPHYNSMHETVLSVLLHLLSTSFCNAGINLSGYHPPRADLRTANFFRSKSPPRGQLFSANSGSLVKKRNKIPLPGPNFRQLSV